MKLVLFTVPGSPPIIAKVISDGDEHIMTVEYPIIFMKEDDLIYTLPYMPLAKSGIVSFYRKSIMSYSVVSKEVEIYYHELVGVMKTEKTVFKKTEEEPEPVKNKLKYLH